MIRALTQILVTSCFILIAPSQTAAAEPPTPNPSPVIDSTPPATSPPDTAAPGTSVNSAPTTPGTLGSPADQAPPAAEKPLPDKPAEIPPPAAVDPAPQKGLPRLHIEANRSGVRLLRIERAMSDDMGEGILVKTVCSAPCDQVIDGRKRQTFFFGAEGMVPSRGFRMARLDGDIVAHVNGGSLIARQTGFLLGGFGGAAILGGATMLGVGYSHADSHLSSEGKVVEGSNPTLTTGGFIVMGAGVALAATAVVLVLTAKTKITLVQATDRSAGVSLEMGTLRF